MLAVNESSPSTRGLLGVEGSPCDFTDSVSVALEGEDAGTGES